jgi:diaminohydroxyphosphoribosylaminopyrimidine deaminase/5-amino-6-(5-phosphoribosylamino)uracil reductase
MFSPAQDQLFMQRALLLAAGTTALTSPNPQVGCVLVRDGEVLGEGAHLYDLYDHAEIAALKQASSRGISATGATAYVTLEPCSHHGRTGPCADALIAAGVSRVVIATRDPNPLVSGRGIEKLRAANIDVTIGILQQEARDLNEAFAHYIRTRTPFVTLKAALSLDGRIAPPPTQRFTAEPFWITGEPARNDVHLLRHASDAILTGIGTVLADDPQLTDRSNLFGPNGERPRRPLLRVVLDTHLRIPHHSYLVRSASFNPAFGSDLLVLTSTATHTDRIAELTARNVDVETIPEHAGRLSLPAVLEILAERDILSVLVEAGSHLNGAFLQQHLVDKIVLYYSQVEIGEQGVPFAHGLGSPYQFEQTLQHVTRTFVGPDAKITGYLHDPWPN